VTPRPGSAPRLSQPLSGFLADPKFAALFHAAAVRGYLPSELSPRRDRAPLSRPHTSLQFVTSLQVRIYQGLITLGFADAHVSRRVGLVPPLAMESLSARPKTHVPILLDPDRRNRTVPLVSSTSKSHSPCESVRIEPSCLDSTADTLSSFPPFRAFSAHVLSSQTRSSPYPESPTSARRRQRTTQARDTNTRLRPKASASEQEDLTTLQLR